MKPRAVFTIVHVDFPGLFTTRLYSLLDMLLILLLGLDEPMQLALSELFRGEGYRFAIEQSVAAAEQMVLQGDIDIVLLPDSLPPVDSEAVVTRLRNITDAPIIVIGGGEGTSIIKSLLDGADLYLARPINHRELLSRIRSLSRRRPDA